jgi:SAM-dependent methyltransferase
MTTPALTNSTIDERRNHERSKYLWLSLRPATRGIKYGESNHGAEAIPFVCSLKPRFVIDFGCGRNNFINTLRGIGIDGLGVDFAFPEADLLQAMHNTGLAPSMADVVTSFDALEHLLPEDVDPVFEEMRRVARPQSKFIFSICTRPSRITVAGEGLHLTVRPLDWWLNRIKRIGTVSTYNFKGRYIFGSFTSDKDCERSVIMP